MPIQKVVKGRYKGQWQVRVQLRRNGKTVSMPVQYAKSKTNAKKLETQLKSEFYAETEAQSQPVLKKPFIEVLTDFVEDNKVGWSAPTYKGWLFTLDRVKDYMPHTTANLDEITFNDIRDFARAYQQDRQLQVTRNGVLNRRLQHLRTFFLKEQVNPSPVPSAPLDAVFNRSEQTAPKTKIEIFTEDEVNKIKARIYDDLKTLPIKKQASRIMLLILLETGVRPEEAQALEWKCLQKEGTHYTFKLYRVWSETGHAFQNNLKSRMQGQTRMTLPLTKSTYQALMTYKKKQQAFLAKAGLSSNLIFPVMTDYRLCAEGKPLSQTSPRLLLQQMCEDLGFNKWVTLYTCRHTVASQWVQLAGFAFTSERLGNSITMLQKTYTHTSHDPQEVDKLLSLKD